jgi:hypothetical protein
MDVRGKFLISATSLLSGCCSHLEVAGVCALRMNQSKEFCRKVLLPQSQ